MLYLSRNNIEDIAQRVIRAYKKLPEIENERLYNISADILITRLLKMNIDYHHLSADGSVLGLTTPYRGVGYKVFDNEGLEEYYIFDGRSMLIESDLKTDPKRQGRHNLTKAHEAGHRILGLLFPNEYIGESKKLHYCMANIKPAERDWTEWQVNCLASSILMPADLVRQALFLFGFDGKIHVINREYAKKDYDRFSSVADFLGVSKQALSIRLSQLGLVDRNEFDNPFVLTDIYNE